jgi:DNA replication protein DnaC
MSNNNAVRVVHVNTMDVRFKMPANFYICGQSQSGKSYLVRSMLWHAEELFNPVPTKIIYCYGIYQKEFVQMLQSMPNLTLVEGFPDNLCEMTRGHDNSLIVLDDLMSQCSNDPRVSDLFTRDSHHLGMSVLYLTQNLFPPGERSRTISLNSHVLIVFRNPRDSLGVPTLARQMFPKHT